MYIRSIKLCSENRTTADRSVTQPTNRYTLRQIEEINPAVMESVVSVLGI
jgi:hypothetical protein